jgi:hypothetical protein
MPFPKLLHLRSLDFIGLSDCRVRRSLNMKWNSTTGILPVYVCKAGKGLTLVEILVAMSLAKKSVQIGNVGGK